MPSRRGRKPNNNLPPNRARDAQRAYRARRAARLQTLEQRVYDLEEENVLLRQALNLLPSERSLFGKGPRKNKAEDLDRSVPSFPSNFEFNSPLPHSCGNSPSVPTLISAPTRYADPGAVWNSLVGGHDASLSPIATSENHSRTPELTMEGNHARYYADMHKASGLCDDPRRQPCNTPTQPCYVQVPIMHATFDIATSTSQSHYPYSSRGPSYTSPRAHTVSN